MSNGIKFVFLLSVILIVMFSMTFAQDTPFNAEVIVETARMRWGPGPAFTVQHYANLGHVLTILEADAESDPPWTWYRARTPSGVVSWIRGDLVRRATGAAARVDLPTGTFPVVDNNLCNTAIFRRCQDGTDHDLWTAGWWANDRYNHWETGGWDLDTVYHNNPCKNDRLCTTREDWDAGAQEAALIVGSLTPDATWTPVYIRVTSEVEIPTTWETITGANAALLLGRTGTSSTDLYTPPRGLYPSGDNLTRWGEFILHGESISVDCYFWHDAYGEGEENVKSGRFGVNLGRLRDRVVNDLTVTPEPDDIDASNVNCGNTSTVSNDIFARQWKITVSRSYGGRNQIGGISWRLEGTLGNEPTNEIGTACTGGCVTDMTASANENLYDYVRSALPTPDPPGARIPRAIADAFPAGTCTLRTSTSGESPRQVTRYEHTCIADGGTLDHTLTFHYRHDETQGFAAQPTPTATP